MIIIVIEHIFDWMVCWSLPLISRHTKRHVTPVSANHSSLFLEIIAPNAPIKIGATITLRNYHHYCEVF